MKVDLNKNFKCNYIRQWFNDNYFISLYDSGDNNIFSFDTIENASCFFNMSLKIFLQSLRNGVIEYNNKRCKLYIYKKDKLDVIERGKCL